MSTILKIEQEQVSKTFEATWMKLNRILAGSLDPADTGDMSSHRNALSGALDSLKIPKVDEISGHALSLVLDQDCHLDVSEKEHGGAMELAADLIREFQPELQYGATLMKPKTPQELVRLYDQITRLSSVAGMETHSVTEFYRGGSVGAVKVGNAPISGIVLKTNVDNVRLLILRTGADERKGTWSTKSLGTKDKTDTRLLVGPFDTIK